MAAHWVQRPSLTAPPQLTTTMDTWVWELFWGGPVTVSRWNIFIAWMTGRLLQTAVIPQWFHVFLFIRTGAFQTSTNPQSPSPLSRLHWWHTALRWALSVLMFPKKKQSNQYESYINDMLMPANGQIPNQMTTRPYRISNMYIWKIGKKF